MPKLKQEAKKKNKELSTTFAKKRQKTAFRSVKENHAEIWNKEEAKRQCQEY